MRIVEIDDAGKAVLEFTPFNEPTIVCYGFSSCLRFNDFLSFGQFFFTFCFSHRSDVVDVVKALPTQLSAIEVELGCARPLTMKAHVCNLVLQSVPGTWFSPLVQCSTRTSQISRWNPALNTKESAHSLTQSALTGSPLQQYVSEGPAFNQRGHQHVPHILPSLFKAGQGIFAEAASQLLAARSRAYELLRSCSYAHTPYTRPSGPKTATLMPRLAECPPHTLKQDAARKAIHHNEQTRNAMWQMHDWKKFQVWCHGLTPKTKSIFNCACSLSGTSGLWHACFYLFTSAVLSILLLHSDLPPLARTSFWMQFDQDRISAEDKVFTHFHRPPTLMRLATDKSDKSSTFHT